jgi:hypothetical protein
VHADVNQVDSEMRFKLAPRSSIENLSLGCRNSIEFPWSRGKGTALERALLILFLAFWASAAAGAPALQYARARYDLLRGAVAVQPLRPLQHWHSQSRHRKRAGGGIRRFRRRTAEKPLYIRIERLSERNRLGLSSSGFMTALLGCFLE